MVVWDGLRGCLRGCLRPASEASVHLLPLQVIHWCIQADAGPVNGCASSIGSFVFGCDVGLLELEASLSPPSAQQQVGSIEV